MVSVLDVAKYILESAGDMTAMKLQKLVYYSQAWSLVWEDEQLFSEKLEAWANGPVSPELYACHRGQFKIGRDFPYGDSSKLNPTQKETIDRVLEALKEKSGLWLSELTHSESPWKDARGDAQPTERSNTEISLASMHEYYSSL